MNIFGIGLPEMAVIFVVALLIFGPKKLPEVGRSLGKALKGFQNASKEFEAELKKGAEQMNAALESEPMEAHLEAEVPPQIEQGASVSAPEPAPESTPESTPETSASNS